MASRILEDFENLGKILEEECKDKMVFYMPNPGNWGDGLIREGTLLFFKDKGLLFKTILPKKRFFYYLREFIFSNPFKKKVLIYGGGGGWTKMWGYPKFQLESRLFDFFFNKVIVLPSTYEVYLKGDKYIYFTRDKFQSKKLIPNSFFCHDMAFYLMKVASRNNDKIVSGKRGYFFRTDKESNLSFSIPKENIDISLKHNYSKGYQEFFNELSSYDIIYTDRLHVAIASCLLNKKLHFWEGSYFKNEAVFKSSFFLFENKKFEINELNIKVDES